MTQSAVSQHVATLERALDLPLIERGTRPVQLTDAGFALVRHARALIARIGDAEQELGEITGRRHGRLRLGSFPTALATFDIGFTGGPDRHLSAHGMAFRQIGAGELSAVNRLCAAIGPDASVVIVDSLTADRFAQVVRGICGTPAAVLAHPTAATVGAVVTGIDAAGRRPVLLAGLQPELANYGGTASEVVNLLTTQEAHNLTAPPSRTWLIHYTVWLSRPTSAPVGGAAA